VRSGGGIRAALVAGLLGSLLVAAAPAQAAQKKPPPKLELSVKAPRQVALLKKVTVRGSYSHGSPKAKVVVTVSAGGRRLFAKKLDPGGKNGSFGFPILVNACCKYVVEARAEQRRVGDSFRVRVPRSLGSRAATALYNERLRDRGFHVGAAGGRVTLGTRLATKAFRKVNGMGRSSRYHPAIFRKLLRGDGAFQPRVTRGRHVEVDISRQVMSLIQGGRPRHTFHVSTGTSATPTIRGSFRFYRKEAGYNSKHMYYSVYFRGGYATHGYNPVPDFPASHGCVRNPIPFSRFIYNWVEIGMPVYVYR